LKRLYFFWIIYGPTIMIISLLGSYVVRGMLKEYQIKRLIIFLDPTIDPKGAGWHIVQSLTAIGSGGFSGKGFLRGTQSHYRYLPQQSTDFIFSIISEEWGFLGGALIFLLFGVLIIRGIRIVSSTKSHFAICTGMGIIGMIGFHVLVNTGMAMGLLPITGIPLFFLSYGGSSLWTAMIAIGLLLNIYKERFSY
jgi:rod shape determining protein RodA